MPIVTVTQLQSELGSVGLPVAGAEAGTTPQLGPATSAQLKVFQARYNLPATGSLDPTTGGILTLAALVTTEGDPAKVSQGLKTAAGAVPASPTFNYWLARYALVTGDYATAQTALHGIDASAVAGADLLGIMVDPGPLPLQPEVPHPENFYSYRNDLIDNGLLDQVRGQLESLTVQQYAQFISKPGQIIDPNTIDLAGFQAAVNKARKAVAALSAWQTGNRHASNRELSLAMLAYRDCQSSAADYFEAVGIPASGTTGAERIQSVVDRLRQSVPEHGIWASLRWRRLLLSLNELTGQDRGKTVGTDGAFSSAAAFVTSFTFTNDIGTDPASANQVNRLDPFMLVLATIWVPLAIGELNCQLRQFDAAIWGVSDLLTQHATVDVRFRYLCEFIEVPFIRLLIIQALGDKADAQYKTGAVEPDNIKFPDTGTYHGLLAAQTYQAMLTSIAQDSADYVTNLGRGRDSLASAVQHSVQIRDTTSLAFRTLGKTLTVPTISTVSSAVPGLDRTLEPHQPIARITPPAGQVTRATNPRLYALGLLATAKLEQIKAGLNYLGYSPDYIPPWRFSFLLDRARYFAEHAKNAQRDYLNFLNNAEHEEFQEQSIAQTVELEQMNVQIETARADQAQLEVGASRASLDLASQVSQDAKARSDEYLNYDEQMQELDLGSSLLGAISSGISGALSGGPVLGAVMADVSLVDGILKANASQLQRDLERHNLAMAAVEANLAVTVAQGKLAVDQAGLVVAGLEVQAAILRHQSAVENLNFLRNQTLNADQWFRLANAIRGVSDIYLRYAIELAFLAQQAAEFEADRRINVIRFDYDLSDVGSMLAADFLLRDLDTLEADLVVGEQTRQQQVRYVVSLAREFPDTLRVLAETGEVDVWVALEQLERHFPGLFNLRIAAVDVQPVALMDPTRMSVELTHLGSGLVRLKAQPGTSPLNATDLPAASDWLPGAAAEFPVKVHLARPETAVFSGLSRQDVTGLGSTTANERAAFEGLPAASLWRIGMSMPQNTVVPGTLADVQLTFTLSGYHDPRLRAHAEQAPALLAATTSFLSAQRILPDAYYSLVHDGKLSWDLVDRMLSLSQTPSALRNLAVLLSIAPDGPELGRSYCHYHIRLDLAAGAVTVRSALPQFTLVPQGLRLVAAYTGAAGTQVTWDFGDDTPLVQGPTAQHVYAGPGRHTVRTQLATNGTLAEYRSAVVVSTNHPMAAPLIVVPTLSASTAAADGTVTLSVAPPASAQDVSIECSVGSTRASADSGAATLKLTPGTYVLDVRVMRTLSARFYSKQCYSPTTAVRLSRGRISTNRTFDPTTGANTTTAPNPLTTQLFGTTNVAISPVDRWTLELPMAENPWFTTVSSADVAEFDGSELSDAVLSLEFLTV